jgi:uncharacterized protein YggE
MKNKIIYSYLTLLLLMLPGGAALAQEPSDRAARPSIRVTGEATVSAKPDQAQIDIGVVTQAQTAQAAATQNAQRLDTVLNDLRRTLGAVAEIKTISYSLTPNYRYPKEGGTPTVTGYTATNVLQVKTGDLAQVGKVIDLATQSGANQIHRLQFTLKDEQAVRAQALREAATKARGKAEAIASALGLKIARVLLVEESSPIVRPLAADMAVERLTSAAPPTPVEPGTIEVRAIITLTVEVSQ